MHYCIGNHIMTRIALTCCLSLPSSLATSMASYELRRSLQTAHCSEGVHQSSTGRTQLQSQATLLLALGTRQCTHLPPLFTILLYLPIPPSLPSLFPSLSCPFFPCPSTLHLPLNLPFPPFPSLSLSSSSTPLPPSPVPHLICVV